MSSFTGQNIYVAWREKVADNYNNGAAISLDLVDIAGTIVGVTNNQTPVAYDLSQNYPNPFNPTTTINFSISKPGLVTLKVYNVLGKEIATLVNDPKVAGSYSVNFNGENLSSGVYFYRLEANDFVAIKKMVLTK
ncbi:MAG: T9SS type A sorting domain-containing protein [Bacteroidetes bacterium]|nr:T9SS type A sorting domain-containing protein [Bacteroidota bacterium]